MYNVRMYESTECEVRIEEYVVGFIYEGKEDATWFRADVTKESIRDHAERGDDLVQPVCDDIWLFIDICELDELVDQMDEQCLGLDDDED